MGSRRIFGMLRASKLAILVDASDANQASLRSQHFREHLVQFLDEQVGVSTDSCVQRLYVATYGTCVKALWPDPMQVSWRAIEEAKYFFGNQLEASGGSNLLAGIKHVRYIQFYFVLS
ncbi:unnamed protein product [Protopolystoma xenopodis]|uniref:VWFA domain-containing protein n=1 Tax=Protopolystoma xenopodis TaxID=117903 RepID=A0A3S5BTT9_9PLAT|nr:unnamed protein product [Protopolystoma xenopodis]